MLIEHVASKVTVITVEWCVRVLCQINYFEQYGEGGINLILLYRKYLLMFPVVVYTDTSKY